jgi:pimeloyl-ACP methyl ester carboxylesterase
MSSNVVRGPAGAADQRVEAAQGAYLNRIAPGHRVRPVRWSGGATQVIEMGSGPPLLLVHGGLGEAFQWGPILTTLARDHRVLAVDRPGHGLADPFDYRGVDLFAHASRFIGDILDAEGIASADIVANSMGGLWAVAFALDHPERVTRLVLVGAPAGITPAQPFPLRLGTLPVLKGVVRKMMSRPDRDGVRTFWKQLLVAHAERLDDDLLDLLVASQSRNCPTWFTLIDRTVDIRGFKRDLVIGDRWKNVAVPTTFVWGNDDAFCAPEIGETVVATNPRFRLVRIPDAGHAPWFDEPELVSQAILQALAENDEEN